MGGTGCAVMRPVVASDPVHTPSFTMRTVEVRPAAVVLELKSATPDCTRLQLERDAGEGYEVLQVVDVDPALRDALPNGVLVIDQPVAVGLLSYQLSCAGEPTPLTSVVNVQVLEPLRRPQVSVNTILNSAVELQWTPDTSGVVFRRDVIAGDSKPERVATIPGGTKGFVDQNVNRGGVYAYRVALTQTSGEGSVQLGFPSEEIYITIPEGE